jgi:uncharacterized protein YjbJ (UPF0337 family)
MNEDKLVGNWKDLKGRVKQAWSKLTDDDIEEMEGNSDRLEGKLQERYGMAREEAREQIQKFKDSI